MTRPALEAERARILQRIADVERNTLAPLHKRLAEVQEALFTVEEPALQPNRLEGMTAVPASALDRQLRAVYGVLARGGWWTVPAINASVPGALTSISAAVRSLRNPENGGYQFMGAWDPVTKKYHYRMVFEGENPDDVKDTWLAERKTMMPL